MAWSVVQHANNSVAGGSATTISVTLPNPVGAGNLVVVFCGCFGATNTATTLSVSDDKGNTYTQKNPIAFANTYPVASFFAENVTNGPKTFTMNQAAGAGSGYPMIQVTEFAPPGAGSAVTFDQANTASTTTQQASVGATTTANNELVWAAFASSPNFSGTIATDAGTGFSGIDVYGGFWFVEWQTQTSAGAVTATANQNAAGNCSCLIMDVLAWCWRVHRHAAGDSAWRCHGSRIGDRKGAVAGARGAKSVRARDRRQCDQAGGSWRSDSG
jgi:hypothetical protein